MSVVDIAIVVFDYVQEDMSVFIVFDCVYVQGSVSCYPVYRWGLGQTVSLSYVD